MLRLEQGEEANGDEPLEDFGAGEDEKDNQEMDQGTAFEMPGKQILKSGSIDTNRYSHPNLAQLTPTVILTQIWLN